MAEERKIEYYQNIAREEIDSCSERNEMYRQIDDMVNCEFELPDALTKLPWIGTDRKFVSNAPRNAVMAATRTFSTMMPSVNIDPLVPEEAEWQRVEKMESALEWHFKQLNYGRERAAHWKIVESAMKYCNVSLQTVYYPYSKKDQSGKRVKAIKKRGDFNFIVHHPANVYPRFSDDMLECVVLAYERRLIDIVYEFGRDNDGVKKLLADYEDESDEDGATLRTTEVYFFDYVDSTDRVVWVTLGSGAVGATTGDEMDAYVLMKEPHGLKFIPWVVRDNGEPILKYVYDTWCNVNIMKTVEFSKHIQLAGHPSYWTKVLSAQDNVEINTDDPSQSLKLTAGQEAGALPPPPMDPMLQKTIGDLESQIYQSSSASVLGSVERYATGNTPFSAINAVMQAAMAQLGLAKLTAEQAETEAFHQILRWIDYSGEPLLGYRDASNDKGKRGEQYAIMPGNAPEDAKNENAIYFDPDQTYLTVSLKAQTITDEQGRITNAINKVERLGFSRQSAYEEVGGINFEQEQEQKAAEQLFDAEVATEIQKKQMTLQLWQQGQQMQMQMQMQQAQMQMQQQAAQQQVQQQQAQQPQNAAQGARQAGAFAGAQGMDTRSGGQTAQGSAPGMGREQVTGQTQTGEALV